MLAKVVLPREERLMSFEIISQRHLTDEEIGFLQRAARQWQQGYDRRVLLKGLGLTGAVLFGSLVPARRAHALVPVLIRAVQVIGTVRMRAFIPATITLYNTAALAVSGPLAVEHKEPTGLIANQASTYVSIPAGMERVLSHSEFRARMVGINEYIATSSDNSENDDFDVID
jgi:hypothetical protein